MRIIVLTTEGFEKFKTKKRISVRSKSDFKIGEKILVSTNGGSSKEPIFARVAEKNTIKPSLTLPFSVYVLECT